MALYFTETIRKIIEGSLQEHNENRINNLHKKSYDDEVSGNKPRNWPTRLHLNYKYNEQTTPSMHSIGRIDSSGNTNQSSFVAKHATGSFMKATMKTHGDLYGSKFPKATQKAIDNEVEKRNPHASDEAKKEFKEHIAHHFNKWSDE